MRDHLLAACCAALLASFQPASADSATAAAELYASTCSACHGRTGRGVSVYPSLLGQTEAYIADRLMTYRARERLGPNSALMIPVAVPLTDAEIASLSAFISTTFQ